jgi:hypothetical protein
MFKMAGEIVRQEPAALAVVSGDILILYQEDLVSRTNSHVGHEPMNGTSAFHASRLAGRRA